MPNQLDPKMLERFVREVGDLLPKIVAGVEGFVQDASQREALEDAYHCLDPLKNSAAMLGFQALHRMAAFLEEMFEEIATQETALSADQGQCLRQATAHIAQYVRSLAANDGQEPHSVLAMVQAFHRFKGMPTTADAAVTAELLEVTVDQVPAAAAVAAPQATVPAAPAEGTDDAELLEGFLIEAEEYAATITNFVTQLAQQPEEREFIKNIRRSAHALKGASGVVGFRTVSRLAHHMQDLLDELYDEERPLTPEIQAMLEQSAVVLQDFVRAQGQSSVFQQAAPALLRAYEVALDRSAEIPAEAITAAPAPVPASAMAMEEVGRGLMDISPELLEGFLLEAEDYLNIIGRLLPTLMTHAQPRDVLQEVRRSVHTFKGAAGVVGHRGVAQLAHRMEDLLDQLYDGQRSITSSIQDLLLSTFDALDTFVRAKGVQTDFAATVQPLYRSYDALLGATTDMTASEVAQAASEYAYEAAQAKAIQRVEDAGAASAGGVARQGGDMVRVPIQRLDDLVRLVGEMVISRSTYEQHLARLVHQVDELRLSLERLRRISNTIETRYEASTLGGGRERPGALHIVSPGTMHATSGSAKEFDALEFDRYSDFTLVSRELGETTADINALGQEFGDILGDFDSYLNRHARLTSEAQDKLMRLRMVPMSTLATRLQRTVRVTAKQQGKDVDLVLEGEEVEFDKTVLEEMAEPLLHLLRNSVDHGIEPPALRQAIDKPQRGQITLRAYTEGTHVVIQVRDDGAGLEPELLRAAAIRGGFVSEAEAPQLSHEELCSFIFRPGFSTAQQVSEISGRGVGADIVQATVNRLKGRVSVDSVPGKGVTFTITLPLTLAITRVLLVKAHEETFAVPLADITHILRLDPENMSYVGDVPVIQVEGQVVPIVRLGEKLRLQQPADNSVQRWPVVVTQVGEKRLGIVVDHLQGGREVVVKTLGNHLRRVDGIIGSTLMGDGSIVLILNTSELMREGRQQVVQRQQTGAAQPVANRNVSAALDIMVVDDSFSVRRVVSNLVKSAGWHPILAKDGLEALNIIQRAAALPDLILLDVEMPQMDGYELTSTLRANAAYRDIPIVMLTSRSGAKHRQKAFEVGATEYLVKPYQDETLLNTVRRLVPRAGEVSAA